MKIPPPELLARTRRSILFSAPLVLAILKGVKTVTRRLDRSWLKLKAGELLYVQETIVRHDPCDYRCGYYAADRTTVQRLDAWRWQRDQLPSIHLPRELSRIVLRVIRVCWWLWGIGVAGIVLALLTACGGVDDGWRHAYRLGPVPHEQGCTVAGTRDAELVRLVGSSCDGERAGWCHPCQDGTPGLCPDLSAPGSYVDVFVRGDVDPADCVVVEACR